MTFQARVSHTAISIHAPRTGSDILAVPAALVFAISIHAPRTGSDRRPSAGSSASRYFNPRSPHGERPRGGNKCVPRRDFNPRSPHGERLMADFHSFDSRTFQSTLPARGATMRCSCHILGDAISIHAPRTGSDMLAYIDRKIFCISIHAPRTGSDG